MTVVVDGESLTLEQVLQVARQGARVTLARGVTERMSNSRDAVERVLARGDAVYGMYGMTTGLGADKRYRVPAAKPTSRRWPISPTSCLPTSSCNPRRRWRW